jgi:NRAMP (natural resistance-associated macrophage protein)-like metal ion transporter
MLKKLKKIWSTLGPGFITGASDDDPSGIATYSQTGAQFGYSQGWTSPFSFPFMVVIQEMCGRIGMVSGKGLAEVIRLNYARPILYVAVFSLFLANTINIGANLGAMASSAEAVIGIPFIFLLIGMTALTLGLEIFVSYKVYSKYLKYLALCLFSYVIVFFLVDQDWVELLKSTFIPSFSLERTYLLNIVAILGTTISPYLFFWQTNEEVEEEVESGKLSSMGHGTPVVTGKDLVRMRKDTMAGMFFSNIIMFFIIATTAATLHMSGITSVDTADQAAEALRPLAGDYSYLLFAIGIIGAGLLSVPVLAGSASYAVSESFGWKEGLYQKFKQAHGFYGAITLATIVGLLVNFIGVPPFKMLYYAAVLNGIVAPILMIMIIFIANNRKVMGERVNSKVSNIMGITITGIMSIAAVALLIDLIL